uniref:Uncharacterized protein n=1 Tax=Arundo donax TaxID=35708 RepID=A0A0A9C9K4_ARUDO
MYISGQEELLHSALNH